MCPLGAALALGGISVLVAVVIAAMNYSKMRPAEWVAALLLFSIAVSAHGMVHAKMGWMKGGMPHVFRS